MKKLILPDGTVLNVDENLSQEEMESIVDEYMSQTRWPGPMSQQEFSGFQERVAAGDNEPTYDWRQPARESISEIASPFMDWQNYTGAADLLLNEAANTFSTSASGLAGMGASAVNAGARALGAEPPFPRADEIIRATPSLPFFTQRGAEMSESLNRAVFEPYARVAERSGRGWQRIVDGPQLQDRGVYGGIERAGSVEVPGPMPPDEFMQWRQGLAEGTNEPDVDWTAATVESGILAGPALLGLVRPLRAGRRSLGRTPPQSPGQATLATSVEDIVAGGDKVTRGVFQEFRDLAGADTQISMSNTLAAARSGLDELISQGKGQSSLAREFRRLIGASEQAGTTTVGILDDISMNMIKLKGNARSTGHRQAQNVIDAVVKDLDAFGKTRGVNFSSELELARAMSALYGARTGINRVIGRYASQIRSFRQSRPADFQQVTQNWAGTQMERFTSVGEGGAKQFNTQRFSNWVNSEREGLVNLLGEQTVAAWERFPSWEASRRSMRGAATEWGLRQLGPMGQLLRGKTPDLRFAENIGEQLANPQSPLMRSLVQEGVATQLAPSATYGVETSREQQGERGFQTRTERRRSMRAR